MIILIRAASVLCMAIGIGLIQAQAEQIVQQASGRGHQHLAPFTVQEDWELRWEVTESHSRLEVVIDKVNYPAPDMPIDTFTQDGPAKGKKRFSKGGTYLLRVIGLGGAWTVTVVQLP